MAVVVVLVLWLALQARLIGSKWPMQCVTATHGLLILLLALTPGARKHFAP